MTDGSGSLPTLKGVPEKFNIGLILGSSGTGKTRLLKERFGDPVEVVFLSGFVCSSC